MVQVHQQPSDDDRWTVSRLMCLGLMPHRPREDVLILVTVTTLKLGYEASNKSEAS